MNDLGKKEIVYLFPYYLREWNRLEREYWRVRRIPVYHFIKQMINLRQREKLTKWYQGKMKEWGIE